MIEHSLTAHHGGFKCQTCHQFYSVLPHSKNLCPGVRQAIEVIRESGVTPDETADLNLYTCSGIIIRT